jgi:HlyD family secretion protein
VANYKVAEANVHVGEAAIEQDKATLHKDEINLGYTVIKSPVKGTVVTRRVNVGQTVVSSLNAPSLFLIAKDLSRLQIWASVNEADIGRIRPGMPVHFTVDAYPNETFLGKVLQIRLNATMTQNVVTYTVVVETDNSDMKLKPYMTANLQFETDHHKDVLMVPNAALRWKPRSSQVVPALRASLRSAGNEEFGKEGRESRGEEAPARPAEGSKSADAKPAGPKAGGPKATESNAGGAKPDAAQAGQARPAKEHVERGRIWIKDGDYVRPVNVRIIATDGTNTEVTGRDLQDGLEVVVGENVAADESGDTTNPFAPKIFKGKK